MCKCLGTDKQALKYKTLRDKATSQLLDICNDRFAENILIKEIHDTWNYVFNIINNYNTLLNRYNYINEDLPSYWNVPGLDKFDEEPVFYENICLEFDKTFYNVRLAIQCVKRLYNRLTRRTKLFFDDIYMKVLVDNNLKCNECDMKNFFIYKYI